jgi:hypothetical protein
MFDTTQVADRITRWSDQLDLPKPLTASIEVYKAAQAVADPFDGHVRAEDITTKNAEAAITCLAEKLAAKEKFAQARGTVVGALSRAVIQEARAAVPGLLDQLQPVFDAAGERLVAASSMLPNHTVLTNDALVGAGVQAITAYGQAQEAAAVLNTIDQWLAGLVDLLGGDHDGHHLRVLDPKDRAEYSKLTKQVAPAVSAAGGAFLVAAQEGIGFRMKTPAEASARLREIQSEPIPGQPSGIAAINRGVWA